MARAAFQVLVIAYRWRDGREVEFAVFRRVDDSAWQFIAGGGEDDETPAEAAVREAREEAAIPSGVKWTRLDSVASVPRNCFPGHAHWPADLDALPEYCFGVDVSGHELRLSAEHGLFEWLTYEQAQDRLTYQSNQDALRELHGRLRRTDEAE
jgi:dATP pyrophosphohydrolase